MLLQKLYVRIWLAVVFAVAVLTLLVGWAWHMTTLHQLHEVVIRDAQGVVIGSGQIRRAADGDDPPPLERSRFGEGPEFIVNMQDGQTLHLHLPRPQNSWRAPFGFFWTLGLVALAVAVATYPIVRRLTRRLEALQMGVEQWGEGNLSARVPLFGHDEVGYLAIRFNRAAEHIEQLMDAQKALLLSQKSLLANASHELRSPLTRIRMGLEMLGPHAGNAAREEITRNIGELDQLIEEILLASRLDAREADLGTVEPVDLVGLAAEECARLQATLEVQADARDLVVPGVTKLLRRAVRNLLENARRHGSGEVTLCLAQNAGSVSILVSDQGPGVPESLQSRIFEPFFRLPGASERVGGVGLGLALVKAIALRHGGMVGCRNLPQGGACFEIQLPLAT